MNTDETDKLWHRMATMPTEQGMKLLLEHARKMELARNRAEEQSDHWAEVANVRFEHLCQCRADLAKARKLAEEHIQDPPWKAWKSHK